MSLTCLYFGRDPEQSAGASRKQCAWWRGESCLRAAAAGAASRGGVDVGGRCRVEAPPGRGCVHMTVTSFHRGLGRLQGMKSERRRASVGNYIRKPLTSDPGC